MLYKRVWLSVLGRPSTYTLSLIHISPLHGHNDHRVVMSLAVLAAAAGLPLTVDDAEAIQKSWPGFFADAAPLGVEVEDA